MALNVIQKTKASIHTDDMQRFYGDLIEKSIKSTRIFDDSTANVDTTASIPTFYLRKTDTVSALFRYEDKNEAGKICILNYASFKHPGGGFLNGAFAQEEALCHESFLYNVISTFDDYYRWNNEHLNRGLYADRALYSPNIIFMRNEDACNSDVLTCASPNWSAARRNGVTQEQNTAALNERICFIRNILEIQMPDTFIAGAFGCGVFKQNPFEVCSLMMTAFRNSCIKNIIFAIPAGPNYDAFEKEMNSSGCDSII